MLSVLILSLEITQKLISLKEALENITDNDLRSFDAELDKLLA